MAYGGFAYAAGYYAEGGLAGAETPGHGFIIDRPPFGGHIEDHPRFGGTIRDRDPNNETADGTETHGGYITDRSAG